MKVNSVLYHLIEFSDSSCDLSLTTFIGYPAKMRLTTECGSFPPVLRMTVRSSEFSAVGNL